ncbi:hypothetical protein [Peribacillus sp. FSL R5-0717]|uniref:hypothetical protein n=1 Tax=Peribacillus sp. FSL R5-0717 TaxID=2975308 RepID=UPI0030F7C116
MKPPRDPFESGDQNNENDDKPEIMETEQNKQPFEKLPNNGEIKNPQQTEKRAHFIYHTAEPKVNGEIEQTKETEEEVLAEPTKEKIDPNTNGEELKKEKIDPDMNGEETIVKVEDPPHTEMNSHFSENREKPVENDKNEKTTWGRIKGFFRKRPNEVDEMDNNDIGIKFGGFSIQSNLKNLNEWKKQSQEGIGGSIFLKKNIDGIIEDINRKKEDTNWTCSLKGHLGTGFQLEEFNRLEDTDIFISFRKGISDVEQEKTSKNVQKISQHPLVKGVKFDILPDIKTLSNNEQNQKIIDSDALSFKKNNIGATYEREKDCITIPVEYASNPDQLIFYTGHEIGHRVTNGPFFKLARKHDFPFTDILQDQRISINEQQWKELDDDFDALLKLREKIATPNELELLETKGARMNITQEELNAVLDKGGTVEVLPAADFKRNNEENKNLPGRQVELLKKGGEVVVLPKDLFHLEYPFKIEEHLEKSGPRSGTKEENFADEMYAVCSEYMLREDLVREKPLIIDGNKHHFAVSQFIKYVKGSLNGDDSRDLNTAVKDILGQLIDIDGKQPEMTESALLWWGVSSDHVNHLKKKEMMIRSSFDEAYELYEIMEGKPIPVNKIAGVFRLTDGKEQRITFWEALHKDPKIDLKKMRGIQGHIQNSSVQDFHKWVSSNECAKLFFNNSRAYYFEDEDVYFISEGNHRAIYAIMTGADTYHVTEIRHHKLKEQKKIEFQQRYGGKIGLLKWLPSRISNFYLNSAKNDWEYTRLQKMINESTQQKKKD